MRIAIIADTHGNLGSLEAVLAEIESEGIEQIACLGDVAGLGPHPREVVARNPPWAEYAVLTCDRGRVDVDLRRVPVDLTAIRRALLASGMPHAEWWAAEWR